MLTCTIARCATLHSFPRPLAGTMGRAQQRYALGHMGMHDKAAWGSWSYPNLSFCFINPGIDPDLDPESTSALISITLTLCLHAHPMHPRYNT